MLHGIFQEDDSFEHTFQILNTHKILCIICTAYTKVTCGPHWAFNSRLGVAKNLRLQNRTTTRSDCVGVEIEMPTHQKILGRRPIHNSHKVY